VFHGIKSHTQTTPPHVKGGSSDVVRHSCAFTEFQCQNLIGSFGNYFSYGTSSQQFIIPNSSTQHTLVVSSIDSYHMVQWCASHRTPPFGFGDSRHETRDRRTQLRLQFSYGTSSQLIIPNSSTQHTLVWNPVSTAITWCSDVLFTRCDYHCIHSSRRLMVDDNSCSASHSAAFTPESLRIKSCLMNTWTSL